MLPPPPPDLTEKSSVLARGSCRERCFLKDQSIAVVLITLILSTTSKEKYILKSGGAPLFS